jgi:glycosyltransferase involved in cell wall biosynthesis
VCVVPSRFEPFGLTAVEALSSGTPVIASTAVGAMEDVTGPACRHVEPGDVAGLEAAIREAVDRVEQGDGPASRAAARAEAERRFSPAAVIPQLVDALERALGGPAGGRR